MDTLKKLFPFSFKEKNDLAALIVNILVYIVIGALVGCLIGILAGVPFVKWVVGILGTIFNIYVAVGIIISILDYVKLMK